MPTMAEYAKSGGYARDAQAAKNVASMPKSSSSGSSSSSRSGSSSSKPPVVYAPPPTGGGISAVKTPAQLAADNAKMYDFYNNNSASAIRDREYAAANKNYDPMETIYQGRDQYGDYRINAAHALMRGDYGGSFGGVNDANKDYVQGVINKNDGALLGSFAKDNPSWWSQGGYTPPPVSSSRSSQSLLSSSSTPNQNTDSFAPTAVGNGDISDPAMYAYGGGGGGGQGYSTAPMGAGFTSASGVEGRVTANVNDEIAKQIQTFNQQFAQSKQANDLAVNKNKQFLDEQLNQLQDSKATDRMDAQTLQNRRGGLYSGGLDYQLGSINKNYSQAESSLQRDVAARNEDIWNRNSLLAQQAAEKVALLQQQAPNVIRQRIQEEIDRADAKRLKEAELTGTMPYDPNLINSVNQQMAANSDAYPAASPEEKQRLHAENIRLAASIGGVDTTGSGDYAFSPGKRTIQGQQLDSTNQKDQRDFAYQAMQDSIKNGQWDKSFELEMQKWADDHNIKWAGLDLDTQKFLAQNAIEQRQVSISQQNADANSANSAANIAKTNAEIDKLNNPQTKPQTVDDAIAQLNKSTFVHTDDYSKRLMVYDQIGLAKAILSLAYAQKDTDYLFSYYNINKQTVNDYLNKQSGN